MEPISYPIRINKYLALLNFATRRGADELIKRKSVTINGRIAVLGDMVNEGDKVEVPESVKTKKYSYFAYYKPHGIITHSPQEGEESINDVLKNKNIFPIGRLDKDSEGLIIMTDDGRITERLLSPEFEHDKEYVVKVNKEIKPSFVRKMEGGVNIDGYLTKNCKVIFVNDFTFRIILTEGKKHQIRRMCAALGYTIDNIKRIRIMNIRLDKIKPNQLRKIEGDELAEFLGILIK
jgi:23S rRNA pseudouridine2604 synthase